jgi:uncharacterized protein YbcI
MAASAHHQVASKTPAGELNSAVARAVVSCHRDRLGRGPTKAQAFHRGNVLVVVMEDAMTKAEQTLADAGDHDTVLELRQAFQQSMRPDLQASVEELTGRKVKAFMSANHIEPDMASQVFVLDGPPQLG